MSNELCPLLLQQRFSELQKVQMTTTLLEDQENKVVELNEDLERLQNLIAQRRAARDSILAEMEINRSLIAPIGRIPHELLSIIFFEYAADPTICFPQVLALVCRRWRDVIYKTPEAWSFLYLAPNSVRYPPNSTLRKLERVGNYPLTVTVNFRKVVGDEDGVAWAMSFADRLRPHSFLSFEVYDVDYRTSLKSLLPFFELLYNDRTGNLIESFKVDFACWASPRDISADAAGAASNALAVANRLTTLTVPSELLHSSHPVLKQLVHLHLHAPQRHPNASSRVDRILGECPRLESLTLDGTFNELPGPAVTLSNLRDLCISYAYRFPGIFETLRTPNLRILVLHVVRAPAPDLTDGLKAFMQQGSKGSPRPPPLVELEINGTGCPERTLVWMLERLPALEVLRIEKTNKIRNVLIQALRKIPTSRKRMVGLKLKRIEFNECLKIDTSELEALVQVRGGAGVPLWKKLESLIVDGKEWIGS
ncbi:hypothetical protein FRB90_007191 [Tulasnella sp. 427]|nr:hypothetical protein FRB90_007191 [Tulasnella sp. 427]